ncbi:hypothetical protein ACFC8N_42775 [Streptomyces sp. NPDC055966]|uniref:hypothetical protein n=1 Tax=Streptomyces sp. NPDC055966 TaxID=3345669 RepID=UPI0035E164CB
MNLLPDPTARQPHATQAGQPTPTTDQTNQIWNDYDRAILEGRPYNIPTSYKDSTPVPAYGLNPPVPQPGRPPMSQRAVDLNTTILTSSVLTVALGGTATGIIWASGHANPTVVGLIIAAPAALAVPILALSRLVKRAKEVVEAAPTTHHHHYNGNVIQDHRTVNSNTRGIWASTRNHLPAGTEEI